MMRLDLVVGWRVMGLVAVLGAAGCPGDDTGGSGSAGSTTSTDSTGTDGTTASPQTGDTGSSGGSSSSGSGSSSGSDSGSDSATSTGQDTESSTGQDTDGTTTDGEGFCEVQLPPPMGCPMPGPEPTDPVADGFAVGAQPLSQDALRDFVDAPLGGGGIAECDIFAQDCPAGDKCMPWANDGGNAWNATRCSAIDPNPGQVGDACTVQGSAVSGIDSCDLGSMCFFVDAQTNEGVCVEMCSCTPDNPVCTDPNTRCSISNGGVLALCREVCNPLDPMACPMGAGCYPSGEFFQCIPDASGNTGAPGETCNFVNACDPGAVCLSGEFVPGCPGGAAGCCTSVCDPDEGNAACLGGQECVPWYEPGAAPDVCLDGTGVCVTPQ